MLKKILLALVLVIAGILGYAATRPDSFRIERSIAIRATPDRIYQTLGDFRVSPAWSPYEKLDPNMQRTFSGPATGKGSVYEWSGNGKAGRGRMEILDETPPNKLVVKLDIFEPFTANNTVEYTIEPQGDESKVTWAMYGPNPYIAKVMQVFCNIDTMVGKDFEAGLGSLKRLLEASPK